MQSCSPSGVIAPSSPSEGPRESSTAFWGRRGVLCVFFSNVDGGVNVKVRPTMYSFRLFTTVCTYNLIMNRNIKKVG